MSFFLHRQIRTLTFWDAKCFWSFVKSAPLSLKPGSAFVFALCWTLGYLQWSFEKSDWKGTELSYEACSFDPLALFHFKSLLWEKLTWSTDAITCWFCYFLKYWVSWSGLAMSEYFDIRPVLWAPLGNPVPRMRFWGPQERPSVPIFDPYARGEGQDSIPCDTQ